MGLNKESAKDFSIGLLSFVVALAASAVAICGVWVVFEFWAGVFFSLRESLKDYVGAEFASLAVLAVWLVGAPVYLIVVSGTEGIVRLGKAIRVGIARMKTVSREPHPS